MDQPTPPIQPFQPESQSPQIQPPSHSLNWLKSISIGFGIVSFCITLAIVGYFITTNKNKPAQTSTIITSPTPTPNPTADWKTYTNTQFGYSFSYPSSNSLKKQPGPEYKTIVSYIGPKQEVYDPDTTSVYGLKDVYFAEVLVFKNTTGLTLDQITKTAYESSIAFCASDKKPVRSSLTQTYYAKEQAYTYAVKDCSEYDGTRYILLKNNYVFNVGAYYKGTKEDKIGYEEITDQILSTFKFTQ